MAKSQDGYGAEPGAQAHEQATLEVEVGDPAVALALSGPGHAHLHLLSEELGIELGIRGNGVHILGDEAKALVAQRVLQEIVEVLQAGHTLRQSELVRAVRTAKHHPDVKLRELFEDVVVVSSDKKAISPRGIAQKHYVQSIRDNDVVFGVGPAGTGKTYLAMAMAVRALQKKAIKRIVMTRPAVEAGEKLGFLPGNLSEKVDPYLRPLYDALHDMMDFDKVQHYLQRGTIEVAPLAFMRGRTLSDSFVVLDEAQNTTPEQMKMFLTRLGMGSKAVITGDITQVDLPRGQSSGLKDALDLLSKVEGVGVCYFSHQDVVRHSLVQRIIQAYESRDKTKPARPPAPARGRTTEVDVRPPRTTELDVRLVEDQKAKAHG